MRRLLTDIARIGSATLLVALAAALVYPMVAQGHWRTPPPEALIAQACVLSVPVVGLGIFTFLVLRGKRHLLPVATCGMLLLMVLGGIILFAGAFFERAAN